MRHRTKTALRGWERVQPQNNPKVSFEVRFTIRDTATGKQRATLAVIIHAWPIKCESRY